MRLRGMRRIQGIRETTSRLGFYIGTRVHLLEPLAPLRAIVSLHFDAPRREHPNRRFCPRPCQAHGVRYSLFPE